MQSPDAHLGDRLWVLEPVLARLTKGNNKSEWEFPLLHEPGEKWTYGASTRVLGLIVEKVTGESLEAFDQEHILRPLGMVDTSYAVPADKQSRVVKLYSHADGAFKEQTYPVAPEKPTPPFRGDGGLYSTAQDYGRFMRMLLNGGRLGKVRILSAKTVHLMGENQIGPVFVSLQPVGQPSGPGRSPWGRAATSSVSVFRSPVTVRTPQSIGGRGV